MQRRKKKKGHEKCQVHIPALLPTDGADPLPPAFTAFLTRRTRPSSSNPSMLSSAASASPSLSNCTSAQPLLPTLRSPVGAGADDPFLATTAVGSSTSAMGPNVMKRSWICSCVMLGSRLVMCIRASIVRIYGGSVCVCVYMQGCCRIYQKYSGCVFAVQSIEWKE